MGSTCVCVHTIDQTCSRCCAAHELGLKLFLPPKHLRGALAPLSTLQRSPMGLSRAPQLGLPQLIPTAASGALILWSAS